MDFDKVLHIATFAGRIILESGGETYRVEETICRICAAYGVRYAESFVTPTGIMVSVYDENNYTTTLVKRVTNRTVDLQKIHLVNELSRKLYTEKYSLDEVLEKYKGHKFHYATTKANHVHSDVTYGMDDMLVFGKETAGIPESILKEHWDDCIRIPMISESRSLNLSNSVAVIAYEAMRQLDYANLKQVGFDHLD